MKKLLLSLATVALTGAFAMAESYTLQFAGTGTSGDGSAAIKTSAAVTDILSSGSSYVSGIAATNNVYLGKNDEGLKFSSSSKNGSLTLTLSTDGKVDATSIVVNAKQYGSDASSVSINGATAQTVTAESADYTFAVTGELTQIKIDATKRLYVSSVTVNYTAGSLQAAGLSFPEGTYTVRLGEEFTAPALTKATDAAATYTSSNEEVATVDAATGAVTILAAGTTVIKATTPATTTYNAGEASYTLNVVSTYNSIADFYTVGEGNKGIIDFPLVVAYHNGINTYAYDLAGNYTLIYGNIGDRERGDIIPAGWEGKYSPYNGLPEIAPVSAPAESVDNVDYTPAEVESVNADMMNYVVVLKKVTFAEDTPSTKSNFTGTTEDGTSYTFRNNFTLGSVVAGTYNVELAVSTYNSNMQLYPTKYTEWTESGVNEITVAEGEAQYYNMQGVRVANPENGMFIRIQNGKAQKVVIK